MRFWVVYCHFYAMTLRLKFDLHVTLTLESRSETQGQGHRLYFVLEMQLHCSGGVYGHFCAMTLRLKFDLQVTLTLKVKVTDSRSMSTL